ncbi:hypothetical protein C0J52_25182 [Blattella germanica]|nr:hypothetical protein C0J52_25182 [Blattella germanica]
MPSDIGMMVMRPGSLPKSPETLVERNGRKPRSRGSSPGDKFNRTTIIRNGPGAGPKRSRGNSPGDKFSGTTTLPQSRGSE